MSLRCSRRSFSLSLKNSAFAFEFVYRSQLNKSRFLFMKITENVLHIVISYFLRLTFDFSGFTGFIANKLQTKSCGLFLHVKGKNQKGSSHDER